MPTNYSDITGGLRIPSQIPLDVKTYKDNEVALANLGPSDNLALTYVQGMLFYCVEEETRWEWRGVKSGEENTGLRTLDYRYPDNLDTFNIDYSDRLFNFFPVSTQGEQGDPGTPGAAASIALGTVTTGAAGSSVIITNSGSSSAATFNFTIPRGDTGATGAAGIDAANNLQKTITASYVLTDADNNYLILINNGATAINITVPTGLMSKIEVGFIQQGSGDVTFVQSGTVISSPSSMKKIKGQHYNAYITQVLASNVYQLVGNLKT